MKQRKLLFAVHAFGFPGHPFPKFWDSYPTLQHARSAARQAIKDGWRECEILRDKPRAPGNVGIERETVETVKAPEIVDYANMCLPVEAPAAA